MAGGMEAGLKTGSGGIGRLLRDQLRNIAPFVTLIVLVSFFSIAAPSFATIGNLENILQQVSVTAMIAVGLTFVILTAEIDLSVGRDRQRDRHRADVLHRAARLRQHRQYAVAGRRRDRAGAGRLLRSWPRSPRSASRASASPRSS